MLKVIVLFCFGLCLSSKVVSSATSLSVKSLLIRRIRCLILSVLLVVNIVSVFMSLN